MKKLFFFIGLVSFGFSAFTQDAAGLRKKHFNLDNGVAVSGYDPVAYFALNKAVKGSKNLAVFHQGVVYQFSSEANKALFKANPGKYEPEYGGWCAYAMGNSGEKVPVDPATFKIVAGKLYLFYNKYFTNTLKDWNKNEAALKKKADENWPILFR
ncbi:MAG: YHS domain protein [Chitinophagaceae bacterium]|nr:YHS domain protein [Chitinophagaceae bacterium]